MGLTFAAAAAATAVLATSTTAGPAWLVARAALQGCLNEADATRRAQCLENAARALDAAEADGQGPLPTPQQARREAARNYGLREGGRQSQALAREQAPAQADAKAKAYRPPKVPREAAGLVTVVTRASLDPNGNWVMTTREGAVWAQSDQTPLSRPPGPGAALTVRPGAFGSFFCLINERREVRCKRRS